MHVMRIINATNLFVCRIWWDGGTDYQQTASGVKGFEKHPIILGGRHLNMTESDFKYDRAKVIIFGKGVARTSGLPSKSPSLSEVPWWCPSHPLFAILQVGSFDIQTSN